MALTFTDAQQNMINLLNPIGGMGSLTTLDTKELVQDLTALAQSGASMGQNVSKMLTDAGLGNTFHLPSIDSLGGSRVLSRMNTPGVSQSVKSVLDFVHQKQVNADNEANKLLFGNDGSMHRWALAKEDFGLAFDCLTQLTEQVKRGYNTLLQTNV